MANKQDTGQIVIISGPSGAGKTSVVRQLLERSSRPLILSVSATTRPPRPGERDGIDYHFWAEDQFAQHRQRGDFLECFEVFGRGYWYGTLRSEVERAIGRGDWILLEIDVQGMQAVVREYPDAITIFVRPQSLVELEARLRGRGTDSEESIQRRLAVARHEWQFAHQYRYDIVNDSLPDTVDQICRILGTYPG